MNAKVRSKVFKVIFIAPGWQPYQIFSDKILKKDLKAFQGIYKKYFPSEEEISIFILNLRHQKIRAINNWLF